MLTYFLKQSPRLTELRLTNIHPTGFHYMSVVLVHKAGFFVFMTQCKNPAAKSDSRINCLSFLVPASNATSNLNLCLIWILRKFNGNRMHIPLLERNLTLHQI